MKKLILLLALLLLAAPLAFADKNDTIYRNSTLVVHLNKGWGLDNSSNSSIGTVTGIERMSTNIKKVGNASGYFNNASYVTFNNIEQYNQMRNFTVACWTNFTDSESASAIEYGIANRDSNTDQNGHWNLNLRDSIASVQFNFHYKTSSTGALNANLADTGILDGHFNLVAGVVNVTDTNKINIYLIINNTDRASASSTTEAGTVISNNVLFGTRWTNGVSPLTGALDGCILVNSSLTWGANSDISFLWNNGAGTEIGPSAGTALPDTTPPIILHYNLSTPSGDCTSWSNDTSTACSTNDTTPTVSIRTDDPTNCAIGLVNKNFTHYEGLGTNRSCENGGTTSLICTLRSQDELTYEDSTIYIGCRNNDGYENATSTSGPLSLTITGLEANGDSAIGSGIQNSLLSGYTNYTTQQVYGRKLDNSQDTGAFDWVAKKGSKTWAFNYITKGEQHVVLFNLTPVLYVLEMSNITGTNITKMVETVVNATK